MPNLSAPSNCSAEEGERLRDLATAGITMVEAGLRHSAASLTLEQASVT